MSMRRGDAVATAHYRSLEPVAVEVGDGTFDHGPGDRLVIPGGVEHAAWVGKAPSVFSEVSSFGTARQRWFVGITSPGDLSRPSICSACSIYTECGIQNACMWDHPAGDAPEFAEDGALYVETEGQLPRTIGRVICWLLICTAVS